MHVLQIAWEYPPYIVGGLGRHVAELLPALAGEGVRLAVIAPRLRDGPEEELVDGVVVRRVPVPELRGGDYPAFVSAAAPALVAAAAGLQADHGRFDLLHAHEWLASEVAESLKHRWRSSPPSTPPSAAAAGSTATPRAASTSWSGASPSRPGA
jgi:glycogen synthase